MNTILGIRIKKQLIMKNARTARISRFVCLTVGGLIGMLFNTGSHALRL